MKPILSIIVPSYKTHKFMDSCLPTFCVQGDGSLEVLLIDDGSPDESFVKAKQYEEQFPSIFKAIHKENGGHGSVINFGIQKALGEYVKIVDGDDWVSTSSLLSLIGFLKETKCDLVVTDYFLSFPDQCVLRKCGPNFTPKSLLDLVLTIHSVTFKRSLFINNHIKVREGVFYEDNEYVLYPLEFVSSFAYLPIPLYFYRLGREGQSVSQDFAIKHIQDAFLVSNDIFLFYRRVSLKKAFVLEKLSKNFIRMSIWVLSRRIITSKLAYRFKKRLLFDLSNSFMLMNKQYRKEFKPRFAFSFMLFNKFSYLSIFLVYISICFKNNFLKRIKRLRKSKIN